MRKLPMAFLFWSCVFQAVLFPDPAPAGELTSLREWPPWGVTEPQIPEVVEAATHFKQGQCDEALALFKAAVEKYPDLFHDPEAYIILADIDLRAGRLTAAGLLFEKAHALMHSFTKDPSRKKALARRLYGGLAVVAKARAELASDDEAKAQKQWATAAEHLQAWLKLEPTSAIAMQRLAKALFKQKTTEEKVQQAYEMLQEAKQADPDALTPAAAMAIFYHQDDDFENAEKFMQYAWRAAPNDFRTRFVAGQWCLETSHLKAGQLDRAREHATKAVRLDQRSADAMNLRGVVALFQKEYAQAERYFLSAHVQSPGNFAARNNLALALCEQRDERKRRRALEYAQLNAQAHPKSAEAEALSTLGWVRYKLGRIDEAERSLRRATADGTFGPDTAYYLARLLTDRGRKGKGRRFLKKALQAKHPFYKKQEAEALLKELAK